ncbi:MAG: type II secretion system major pseudopilin GspG [Desulfobacterales bacterium]|nr:type II secretion system major pseudopilin GspG [Desulfobacterales bacterium]
MYRLMDSRGFTLIEILIVVIIIGMLGALVGPNVYNRYEKAKWNNTKNQINMLDSALDDFRLDNGRYPTTEEGLESLMKAVEDLPKWSGPYLKKAVPNDEWGRPFVYQCPGEHGEYDLYSYGKDGTEGGEKNDKDVVNWE